MFELNMASWTWQTVALLWVGALTASVVLIAVQLFIFYRRAVAKNTKFFWLLPCPGSVAGVVGLLRAVARRAPLIAVAVYVVPAVALLVTIMWGLRASD
jgi:hypothetical protein